MNAARLAVLVAALAAHGCASLNASPNGAAWWRVARPEWVPPQGLEWAIAQCNARAAGVSGVDQLNCTEAELLRRAVRGACRARGHHARWWYVSRVFAVGSGTARELCRRFGVDPWQEYPI